jgi:hypothetical protein
LPSNPNRPIVAAATENGHVNGSNTAPIEELFIVLSIWQCEIAELLGVLATVLSTKNNYKNYLKQDSTQHFSSFLLFSTTTVVCGDNNLVNVHCISTSSHLPCTLKSFFSNHELSRVQKKKYDEKVKTF